MQRLLEVKVKWFAYYNGRFNCALMAIKDFKGGNSSG